MRELTVKLLLCQCWGLENFSTNFKFAFSFRTSYKTLLKDEFWHLIQCLFGSTLQNLNKEYPFARIPHMVTENFYQFLTSFYFKLNVNVMKMSTCLCSCGIFDSFILYMYVCFVLCSKTKVYHELHSFRCCQTT